MNEVDKNEWINAYHANGYFIFKEIIDKDVVSNALSSIEAIFDAAFINLEDVDITKFNLDQKYMYLLANHAWLKSRCYDLMKFLPELKNIMYHDKLLAVVKTILGISDGGLLVDYPQFRIDDPSNSRMTAMHQEGYGQLSLDSINAWIPLVDVSKQSGTLAVIPNSHLDGWKPHMFYNGPGLWGHGVKEQYYDKSHIQYIEIPAGSAVIFDSRLVHGTSLNHSENRTRWTAVARYSNPRYVAYLQDSASPMHIEQKDG